MASILPYFRRAELSIHVDDIGLLRGTFAAANGPSSCSLSLALFANLGAEYIMRHEELTLMCGRYIQTSELAGARDCRAQQLPVSSLAFHITAITDEAPT